MHNQFEFLFIYFTRFSFAIRGLPLTFPLSYFSLIVSYFILFVKIALWASLFIFIFLLLIFCLYFPFFSVVLAAHKVIYFT